MSGDESPLPQNVALWGGALILIIAGAVGTIGLFLFKSWGRRLCLWSSVLMTFLYPFFGPSVYSSWASMLDACILRAKGECSVRCLKHPASQNRRPR